MEKSNGIRAELLDELLAGVRTQEDMFGPEGLIKRLTKAIADRLDERTIIPARSDCLKIDQSGGQLFVQYENDRFAFPIADVVLLPIMHSSAEELAQFVWNELRIALEAHGALADIVALEISVAEGPGQAAIFRQQI